MHPRHRVRVRESAGVGQRLPDGRALRVGEPVEIQRDRFVEFELACFRQLQNRRCGEGLGDGVRVKRRPVRHRHALRRVGDAGAVREKHGIGRNEHVLQARRFALRNESVEGSLGLHGIHGGSVA